MFIMVTLKLIMDAMDHNGNKYSLLSCAILSIIMYVTSLSVIHVFILLNKVKSNQKTR